LSGPKEDRPDTKDASSKPDASKPSAPSTTDKPKPTVVKPIQQMRDELDTRGRNIKALSQERDDWKHRYEALNKERGGDTTALTKTIEEQKKQIESLQGEVAGYNYARHPDFIRNYQKPFQDAIDRAKQIIPTLTVIEMNGEEESRRKAAWEDFQPIAQMSRENAKREAKRLFGDDASDVMAQYDRLSELWHQRSKALEDYSKTHEQVDSKNRSEKLAMTQKMRQAFEIASNDILEQHRELFDERADDAEGNAMRRRQMAIIDEVFFEPDKLPPEELAARSASIRWRAINHDRLKRERDAAIQELEELKASMEGSDASISGRSSRAAPKAEQTQEQKDKEDDDLLKAAFGT
jgi:hypothetical protein